MNKTRRPSPDELLSRIEAEDRKAQRGRLKVFFGSSAGVGKTYAMLSAAREQMEQGRNVLIGIVETHGRVETERLLEGLLILQPLEVNYRGMKLKELDLEAALTRKPEILLVDELAHSNAPGCRHPKRWNDVIELLDAGIDVYTTLNVQHIESLSDLVAGTTGVWIKETVPDFLFDMAEDIVLVDIDEDDLIKRLNEGKVYVAPGAKARAAENFFKKNNLSALREIALRRTAERVDAGRGGEEKSDSNLPIAEKLLVCVGTDSLSPKLIRSGKRMANALKCAWTVLYVDVSGLARLPEEKARRLETLEKMVDRMGSKLLTVHADDIAEEVTSYAHKHGFSKIVVGKDFQFSFRHLIHGYLIDHIIRKSGSVDVYIVTDDRVSSREPLALPSFSAPKLFDYLLAFLVCVGFSVPGLMMPDFITGTDQALFYLTGIVVAAESLGLGPSLFYVFLSALSINVFFMAPLHTFTFENKSYLITFLVMIVTGATLARQASRLRAQAIGARERESRTTDLYTLTRKLTSTRGRFPVSEVVGQFVAQTYDLDATVWMTNSEGHPAVILGNLPEETYYKDFGALQWCFENAQNAGRGTSTMPSAAGFYLPLTSGSGTLGVMGLFPRKENRPLTREEVSGLETLASLLASALERVRAGEIAQQVMIEKESAKLRASLTADRSETAKRTASILEPLRTVRLNRPDMIADVRLSSPPTTGMESSIRIEKTLMDFFNEESLKTNPTQLNRRPTSLLDRIEKVREKNAVFLSNRPIELKGGQELPDILVDIQLVEQLLEDVLLFAAGRNPLEESVSVKSSRLESEIHVEISDKGPLLDEKTLDKLFDMPAPNADTLLKNGVINLSVAAGIVRLHGGAIGAKNNPKGKGLTIDFTLPIA